MPDDPRRPDEDQALAALYALGALDSQEAADFAARWQAGDAAADPADFARVVQLLGYSVAPVSPPTSLRERLLTSLRTEATSAPPNTVEQRRAPESLSRTPFILRANEGTWAQSSSPGVFIRTLFFDAVRQYATLLLRIEPGALVERHQHADTEELYVLEGSCRFDEYTFQVGDYVRMPAGSVHNTGTSDTGCLLLVVSSTRSTALC